MKKIILAAAYCCLLFARAVAMHTPQDEVKVTLDMSHQPLAACIRMLEARTGLNFVYDSRLLESIPGEITHNFRNTPFKDVLSFLLQGTRLEYKQQGNTVILLEKPAPVPPGTIKGRVVDFENSNPLAGATISISGTGLAAMTNEKGYYEIHNIPPGKYIVIFSHVGYQSSRLSGVQIESGKVQVADFKLQAGIKLDEVVIRSGPRHRAVINTTDEQLLHEIYAARTVVSGISNEQIARSMDVDAAEVVRRVSGVNVTDDRFIVVRGLNKRYNVTFLNNNIAPATEPDSKAFSFDQVPSNAIDHILVYKSPSPDLVGDFAGGVVKIFTKKSMFTRQLDLLISAQYRPGSSFTDITSYPGGKYDWLGFDDGTRSLPAGIPNNVQYGYLGDAGNAKFSAAFKNNYQTVKYHSDLDKRIQVNYYDAWRMGHRYLNNLTSLSFTNTTTNYFVSAQRNGAIDRGFIEQGSFNGRIGLIQTNNIKLNKDWTLELKNFINQQGNKLMGRDAMQKSDYSDYLRNTNLGFQNRFVYSGQLSNYYNFGKKGQDQLFVNLGYTTAKFSDPDMRQMGYHKPLSAMTISSLDSLKYYMYNDSVSGPWRFMNASNQGLRRLFTTVKEHSWQSNVDFEHPFTESFHLKTGAYWEYRYRDVSIRSFELENGPGMYDPNIGLGGYGKPGEENLYATEDMINTILRPEQFRPDGSGFRYADISQPGDTYLAENQNISGYASLDLHSSNKEWEAFGGLRVEHNNLRILGARQSGQSMYPLDIRQRLTSWLPSVNVSWRPDSAIVLRGGYGRTVNRAEFREIAPFSYKDFLNFYNYTGNPDLHTVNIDNADLRLEWYPKSMLRNEMFSFGIFYKHLDHPIEQVLERLISYSGLYWDINFVNSGPAKVYGAEAEIRKSLSFISGRFARSLSIIFNSTYVYSRVDQPGLQMDGNRTGRKRPLQGQAPYIINLGLNYENPAIGTKVAAIYNRTGDMITLLGNSLGDIYDVMQRGRDQVDISYTQRVNKWLQLKAGVQNLLNGKFQQYQDVKRNYRYDPKIDDNYRSFKTGAYYSLGFNFIL